MKKPRKKKTDFLPDNAGPVIARGYLDLIIGMDVEKYHDTFWKVGPAVQWHLKDQLHNNPKYRPLLEALERAYIANVLSNAPTTENGIKRLTTEHLKAISKVLKNRDAVEGTAAHPYLAQTRPVTDLEVDPHLLGAHQEPDGWLWLFDDGSSLLTRDLRGVQ